MSDNKMTEIEINELAEMTKEATPEEVMNMRESIEDVSSIEAEGGDEGFSEEIKNISLDSSYEELLAGELKDLPVTSADIFEVINNKELELTDEELNERAKENLSQMFDMPEDQIIVFCDLLNRYRKDKKSIPNVFKELPDGLKDVIRNVAEEQGVPFTEYNNMAKMFIDEFVNQAELDEIFVDFEKSLDEALKMPTIADMYSEHTREVMEVKIPEIIEKIKDTEPENAKILEDIRSQFYKAYSLELLKEHYETNARTRKLMRRDWENPIRFCDEFNLKNDRSKFKMPDCRSIGPALCHVFLSESYDDDSRINKMAVNEVDLNKFAILFCRTCINMDPSNIYDAAYMYYSLKNITMLNLTNETKTPFAAELINNICDIIEFVREKEAEFNASNKSNNKRKK